MRTIKVLFSKYKVVFLVVLLSMVAVTDLFHYGIPPTHDAEYHIMRFSQFYKVLSDGILYPRWAPDFNNGFGIPLFTYVYPFPNYAAAILHFLGFGFIDAFKASSIIAEVLGAILFYLWSKKFWGEMGGLISSVFFSFAPYHLLDIYVRGSIGEVWALALFPGFLWTYSEFLEKKRPQYFVLSCIFLGLTILAHNILALMFFGFFLFYSSFLIFYSKKRNELILGTILIVALGFGLSAPFWLPALLETSYTQGLQIFDVTQNFTPIYKFFVPTWGFGLSPSDPLNPMSVQIGYANLIVIFVSVIIALTKRKGIINFFLASFFIVFFLMTGYSSWFWQHIPLMNYFQFPWRLLSLEIIFCSFLAGSLFSIRFFKQRSKQIILAIFMIVASIGLSLHYIRAPFYFPRTDAHYLSRPNFTDGTNSPGNVFNTKWLSAIPSKAKNKIEIKKGRGSVEMGMVRTSSYAFDVILKEESSLLINTAYFPGFKAIVDGHETRIVNANGKIMLNIPKGKHSIYVYLDSTNLQKISYVYFLLSVLLIILLSRKEKFLK